MAADSLTEWGGLPEGVSLPALLKPDQADQQSAPSNKASHWVGADWNNQIPVVVKPKYEFLQAGLMLAEVLHSKIEVDWKVEGSLLVCRTKGKSGILLRAKPSEKRLYLPTEFPAKEFLLVQVVAFVNALCDMLERRQKTDRTAVRRSYTAEIRGRLNVARSIQSHWAHGESHKVVCDLTQPSLNIPLNQVFVEALKRYASYLTRSGKAISTVEHKLRRARSLLHGVERLNDNSSRNHRHPIEAIRNPANPAIERVGGQYSEKWL